MIITALGLILFAAIIWQLKINSDEDARWKQREEIRMQAWLEVETPQDTDS